MHQWYQESREAFPWFILAYPTIQLNWNPMKSNFENSRGIREIPKWKDFNAKNP